MKNKLLNFTICQIFVVIGMSVSYVECEQGKTPQAVENVTHFDRSFQKVLSRRKRFLLWRPGSNVLLTASLVKPLAFTRPGGHNLIIEWDIFYPLPSSWYKPTKPTKAAPPVPITEAPEKIEALDPHSDHHSNHPGEIWMPSGGWSPDSDVIKTLSEAEPSADKRIWSRTEQLRQSDWKRNNLFHSLPSSPITQFRNPLLYNQPWQQRPQTNSIGNGKINFNQQYYQSNRRQSPSSSSYSEKNFMNDKKQRKMNFMPKGRSLEMREEREEEMQREESTDGNWKHHQAHRDRRELYRRIETTSPLVPIRDDMDDDYSSAMRRNHQDCASVYSEKCPMSILAFLLQSKL